MRPSARLWATAGVSFLSPSSSTSGLLSAKRILSALQQHRTEAFFGLPHHALRPIATYARYHTSPHDNALCTGAEQAVALAAGHYLATGRTACIYASEDTLLDLCGPLCRLGLGPTTEAAPASTAQAPSASPYLSCLMLVGCDGRGTQRRTEQTLESLHIPFQRVDRAALGGASADAVWETAVETAYDQLHHERHRRGVYAILLDMGLVEAYRSTDASAVNALDGLTLSLKSVAEQIGRQVNATDIIVCAEGMLASTVLEARTEAGHVAQSKTRADRTNINVIVPEGTDVASVAAGVALASPDANVYCVRMDAEAVAHLGVFAAQAHVAASADAAAASNGPLVNLRHIIVSSGAYLSPRGQYSTGLPTPAFDASIAGVAMSCGCASLRDAPVLEMGELISALGDMRRAAGLCLLEVVIAAPPLLPNSAPLRCEGAG